MVAPVRPHHLVMSWLPWFTCTHSMVVAQWNHYMSQCMSLPLHDTWLSVYTQSTGTISCAELKKVVRVSRAVWLLEAREVRECAYVEVGRVNLCVPGLSCLSPSGRHPGVYLWWPRDAFAWNQGHRLAGNSGRRRKAWQVLHEIQYSLNESILLSHGALIIHKGNDIKSSFNTLKHSKD